MPRHNYPPEHQADINFVYGYCNGNSMEAVREYQRQFPNRTVPDNQTFINIAVLCTFLALLAAPTLGQDSQILAPPSPCPTVFTYDPHGPEPGWWSGVINLSTDFLLHSLWLDIVLDSQALKLLFRMAEANTQDFKRFRIEDEDMQIQPRIQTSLRFSVQFDMNNRVPRLQMITVNGIVICNALLAEREKDSKLKTNINTNKRPVINPSKQSINPVATRLDNSSDPGNISNAGDISSGSQTQCGTSTRLRQWPWVAAVYRSYDMSFVYICGGSLLSHRHVITAAQCVQAAPYPSQTIINENNLVVYLGKQNLNSVLGVQIRLVQEIIVSPYYIQTKSGHMHDAALLVLHEPVKYTDLVRPACLWPANEIDLDNVIGKKGVLIGWAYNDKNEVIDQLTDVEVPVVSQETCIESEDFVNYTNTDSTYCAGSRQDTVLCKGVDTGNGMFFKMGDSWYLRGHVTSFLHRQLNTQFTCDPTHFIQFTDVAKSVPWIHGIVSNFL